MRVTFDPQEGHPHPGQKYRALDTQCYLPNTAEGRHMCSMLIMATEQGLLFKVAASQQEYQEDCIVAVGVTLKTQPDGE